MTEKLCVFCNHLEYNSAGCGAYAEPADLECLKGHKLLKEKGMAGWQSVYSVDDFRKMIVTAETCPDYDQAGG